jgi:hypothetical protein
MKEYEKYDRYSNYVSSICDVNNLSDFKSNPNYKYMLEHVSKEQGEEYLRCIFSLTKITMGEVENFCTFNDAIGHPDKVKYDNLNISISPTSLRYIYHAHLILTHMKDVGHINSDIIELGGGYGGLCLSLYHFAPKYGVHINSYKICDLPNIIRLQKTYLNKVDSILNVELVDASSFGANIDCANMFLVSNYCFSEISKENQDSYRKILFPKISHGFIAWNYIPVYDFGFDTLVEPEIPNTGGELNKYVYF